MVIGRRRGHSFFSRLEIKCLISHISLGSVAQGAWKLEHLSMGRGHFFNDPCVFGYIFQEKVPIETFYISS